MTRTAKTDRRAARPGFTLVELMVAAAVCVIIMAILATCFQSGIDTLRQLRSQGDMTDQLRAAEVVIKRDLQAKRFTPEDGKPNQGVRLSDQRLDLIQFSQSANGTMVVTGWTPPVGGFMRIKSTPPIPEGFDSDLIESDRATDHIIHFTSVLPGGTDQNVFTATVGSVTYTSPAAEIAYFLDTATPIGSTGGVPLYNLIRRQRLAAVNTTDRQNFKNPDPAVISISGLTGVVNTLADLTNPNNRMAGYGILNGVQQQWVAPNGGVLACNPLAVGTPLVVPSPPSPGSPFADFCLAPANGQNGGRLGDDVLLSNVISFQVKVNWDPMTTFGGMAIQPVGFPKPSPTTPLPPWIAPRAYSYPGGVPSPYFPYNDNDNDGQPDANSDHPFDFLPGRPAANPPYPNNGNTPDNWTSRFNLLLNTQAGGANVFDTWTGNRTAMPNWDSAAPHNDAIPMRVRVKAVQIRIRIYDPKLKNSRQLTIVQDL